VIPRETQVIRALRAAARLWTALRALDARTAVRAAAAPNLK
jgi:hypothetical protein